MEKNNQTNIPTLKTCIEYMHNIGWHFKYRNSPWYVFCSPSKKTWSGSSELTFTLKELRHAYRFGF